MIICFGSWLREFWLCTAQDLIFQQIIVRITLFTIDCMSK